MAKKKETRKKGDKLESLNQEIFCQHYAGSGEHFGNAVWSYVMAYGVKLDFIPYSKLTDTEKKKYQVAKQNAHRLLTNDYIRERCNEILDSYIKDDVVDRETIRVIIQNKELSPKVAAIREYNNVKQRIIEQHTHTIFEGKSDDNIDRLREGAVEELVRRRVDEALAKSRRGKAKEKGKQQSQVLHTKRKG